MLRWTRPKTKPTRSGGTAKERLAAWAANNIAIVALSTVVGVIGVVGTFTGALSSLGDTVTLWLSPENVIELVATRADYRQLEFTLVNTTSEALEVSSIVVHYLGMLDGCPNCIRMGRIRMDVVLSGDDGSLQCAGAIEYSGPQRVLGGDASVQLKPKEGAPMSFSFTGEDVEGAVLLLEFTLVNLATAELTKLIPTQLLLVPSAVSAEQTVTVLPFLKWRSVRDDGTRRDVSWALSQIGPHCCSDLAENAARYYRRH